MKVFTDYGTGSPALESCILEVEDSSEWALISLTLEQELKRREEVLITLKTINSSSCDELEKSICTLKKLIFSLEVKNTIPMSNFNIKKITKSLWKDKG